MTIHLHLKQSKIVNFVEVQNIKNTNRKFQYGDGFFETIIVKNGTIKYWKDHYERIVFACKTLNININKDLKSNLEKEIISNCTNENSRVKIQFWRSGEGKYTPEQNELKYNIEVTENKTPFFTTKDKIDFCITSKVIPSEFSSFKCFLLPYIIAGKEKSDNSKDDLILLNGKGEIAECISSNIFWTKNEKIFTPSLESGCLNGVMRKQIISQFDVNQGLFQKEYILNADSIFCCNVTGITQFKKMGERKLELLDLENFFQNF